MKKYIEDNWTYQKGFICDAEGNQIIAAVGVLERQRPKLINLLNKAYDNGVIAASKIESKAVPLVRRLPCQCQESKKDIDIAYDLLSSLPAISLSSPAFQIIKDVARLVHRVQDRLTSSKNQ